MAMVNDGQWFMDIPMESCTWNGKSQWLFKKDVIPNFHHFPIMIPMVYGHPWFIFADWWGSPQYIICTSPRPHMQWGNEVIQLRMMIAPSGSSPGWRPLGRWFWDGFFVRNRELNQKKTQGGWYYMMYASGGVQKSLEKASFFFKNNVSDWNHHSGTCLFLDMKTVCWWYVRFGAWKCLGRRIDPGGYRPFRTPLTQGAKTHHPKYIQIPYPWGMNINVHQLSRKMMTSGCWSVANLARSFWTWPCSSRKWIASPSIGIALELTKKMHRELTAAFQTWPRSKL